MTFPIESHLEHLGSRGLVPFFHRAGLFFCLWLHERERSSAGAITAALLVDRGGPHFSLAFGPGDWVLVRVADCRGASPSEWTVRDATDDFYTPEQIPSILEAMRRAGEAFVLGGKPAVQIVDGDPSETF